MAFGLDDLFSFAAPVVSGLIGASSQSDTNSANAAQAQAQMDFQERMSDTAYQRQVKDLNAAGLNPMLAYMKSSAGASTPSGAMAVMQSPYEAGARIASSAYGNRLQAAQARKTEVEGVGAELDNVSKEAAAAQAYFWKREAQQVFEWKLNQMMNESLITNHQLETAKVGVSKAKEELANLAKQGELLNSQAAVNRIRETLMKYDVPEASAFAKFFQSAMGKAAPYSREAGRAIGDVTGAARDLGGLGLKARQQRFMIHGE